MSSFTPKISVVIPTYNRLSSLPLALKSVAEQTYAAYEILVVDDASSDGSREYLSRSKKDFPTLKALHLQENRGVSAARNAGIKEASGDWIALLDSDDQWLPQKLETQIGLIDEHPECPLIHSDEIWLRNGVRVNAKDKYKKRGGDIFEDCFELCRVSPSTALIKKQLFDDVGVFREDFPVCEDFELWLRITSKYPTAFSPQFLTIKTGGHEDQLSTRFKAMDYWRVKALSFYLDDQKLTLETRIKLAQVMKIKCEILLKGYEKHNNRENEKEVLDYLNKSVEFLAMRE